MRFGKLGCISESWRLSRNRLAGTVSIRVLSCVDNPPISRIKITDEYDLHLDATEAPDSRCAPCDIHFIADTRLGVGLELKLARELSTLLSAVRRPLHDLDLRRSGVASLHKAGGRGEKLSTVQPLNICRFEQRHAMPGCKQTGPIHY